LSETCVSTNTLLQRAIWLVIGTPDSSAKCGPSTCVRHTECELYERLVNFRYLAQ